MQMWAQIETHAVFLVFVAGAVYAQALTGFALALILLGLGAPPTWFRYPTR